MVWMMPFRVLQCPIQTTVSGIPVSGRHVVVELLHVYCTLTLCKLSLILHWALVELHSQRVGKRVTENLWILRRNSILGAREPGYHEIYGIDNWWNIINWNFKRIFLGITLWVLLIIILYIHHHDKAIVWHAIMSLQNGPCLSLSS